MNTTTTTAATTAPCWVNLDELVSPETRAKFAAFAERLDTYGPHAGDKEYVEALCRAFNDETDDKDVPDGLILEVAKWVGYEAVENACERAGLVIPE